MKVIYTLVALFMLLLLHTPKALEASFYDGKTIRLIVSSTPGGGNDTYSRLVARHISKYIPGNPTMVVQNMPGAGGLLAADYLYRKAARDGTVMEQINWGVWNYQVIKDKRARFDFNKMNAVGVVIIENAMFYVRRDRFASLDELIKSGKKATVGTSGRQGSPHILGNLIEKVTGQKLFEYVFGYPGARQYNLAVRQGEVDASASTFGSGMDQVGDLIKSGELVVLVQAGTEDGKRGQEFPNVPTLLELAKTPEAKKTVQSTFLLSHYGRPYALPPDVPKERIQILRNAFWKTMSDPKFLEEAKRLKRDVQPLRGEDLQRMWKDTLNAPPDQVKIVQEIFGGKKK